MSLDALHRHRPGEIRAVASAANEAVKAIRALDLRKHRDDSGLFVAEGARTLIEAIETGSTPRVVAHLGAAREEAPVRRIVEAVRTAGGLVLEVDRAALEKMSRRDNPQTVIGVMAQRWTALGALPARGRLLALDRVRDPGNLGTILRTADAFGVSGVILIGETTDPYAIEAVRASMGSIFAVDLARVDEAGFIAWRRGFPGLVVGTHLDGAVDLRAVDWRDPTLIVMGSERDGLTEALAAACDQRVRIAMSGRADSLNLAVATAITLHESVRGG